MTRSATSLHLTDHDQNTLKNIPKGTDDLYNRISYFYLKNILQIIETHNIGSITSAINIVKAEKNALETYSANYAYGDLYKRFMQTLDTKIDDLYKNADPQFLSEIREIPTQDNPLNGLQKLIDATYNNDNHALEQSGMMLKAMNDALKLNHAKDEAKSLIHKAIQERKINQRNPKKAGERLEDISSALIMSHGAPRFLISNYVALFETNVPTQANFSKADVGKQIRMGTPTQVLGLNKHGVYSIFKAWLDVQAIKKHKVAQKSEAAHVYFNCLPYKTLKAEQQYTHNLLDLENQSAQKIAVITLPSNGFLMGHHDYKKTDKNRDVPQVKETFLRICMENKNPEHFYISPFFEEQLFGDKKKEILEHMLDQCFSALHIKPTDTISIAEEQAVFFYFIKFKLTDYILNHLKPLSFNFTCKDGIDRGGIASVYYNLMKSIETGKYMTESEFYQALSAPMYVKGRPMNNHICIVWNSVYQYLSHLSAEKYLELGKEMPWLSTWINQNRPSDCQFPPLEAISHHKRTLHFTTNTESKEWLQDSIFKLKKECPHYHQQIKHLNSMQEHHNMSAFISSLEKELSSHYWAQHNLQHELQENPEKKHYYLIIANILKEFYERFDTTPASEVNPVREMATHLLSEVFKTPVTSRETQDTEAAALFSPMDNTQLKENLLSIIPEKLQPNFEVENHQQEKKISFEFDKQAVDNYLQDINDRIAQLKLQINPEDKSSTLLSKLDNLKPDSFEFKASNSESRVRVNNVSDFIQLEKRLKEIETAFLRSLIEPLKIALNTKMKDIKDNSFSIKTIVFTEQTVNKKMAIEGLLKDLSLLDLSKSPQIILKKLEGCIRKHNTVELSHKRSFFGGESKREGSISKVMLDTLKTIQKAQNQPKFTPEPLKYKK